MNDVNVQTVDNTENPDGERDPMLTVLLDTLLRFHPTANAALVEKAYTFAAKAHEGQKRKSGEPYFIHPYRVAEILAGLTLDDVTIAAGLLHDCVEDIEEITLKTIETEFGTEVMHLVDGVTKLTGLDFTSREERQAESLRKMFLAMAKDIRVVLIKLADRLHNMRTLKFQRPERQVPIARETLDVYAPLAHRLGISSIKWELEDLALRYIDPDNYYKLVDLVGMKRAERQKSIDDVIGEIRAKLREQHIEADIEGRPKHFYSIYRKMFEQGKAFEEIYDLIAVRVIVDTVQDCYGVLGIVHTLWMQVPGRFKDYISMPKPNMYRSLHTTLVSRTGMPFEVQIRTHEMHRESEFGIAAHWNYKEKRQQADGLDKKLYWLRQILDWQNETRDSSEFMDALKVDLFADEVFVFTPKGDVVNLPKGATPLDFAFRIHTEVGVKCSGAKVNGRIVNLGTELQTGDFVEVMTAANKTPSRDWLQMVHTSEARTKLRSYFKKEFSEEYYADGRDMLEAEAKRQGYQLSQLTMPEILESVQKRYSVVSKEDLYIDVGCGGLSTAQVVNRMIDEYRRIVKVPAAEPVAVPVTPVKTEAKPVRNSTKNSHGVIVAGNPGMLVRFARCCNPVPGDDIVGYITRGRGVSVHRRDCINIMNSSQDDLGRMIDVSWEGDESAAYDADICVKAYDRKGLLADLSMMLTKMEVNITALSARTEKNGTVTINVTVNIKNTQQLETIISQLHRRSEILEVFRPST